MTVLCLEQNAPYDPDMMRAKPFQALVFFFFFFVNLNAIKFALARENEACTVNSYCSLQIDMDGRDYYA